LNGARKSLKPLLDLLLVDENTLDFGAPPGWNARVVQRRKNGFSGNH